MPSPEEPIDASRTPGLDNGAWTGWPAEEKLDWQPENIQRRYGRVEVFVLNGDFMVLPSDQAVEIAAALEENGYNWRRDQVLTQRACGW